MGRNRERDLEQQLRRIFRDLVRAIQELQQEFSARQIRAAVADLQRNTTNAAFLVFLALVLIIIGEDDDETGSGDES